MKGDRPRVCPLVDSLGKILSLARYFSLCQDSALLDLSLHKRMHRTLNQLLLEVRELYCRICQIIYSDSALTALLGPIYHITGVA